jgi:hypothetical protein
MSSAGAAIGYPLQNPHEIATDCQSFNTTLRKAGFEVPDINALDLDHQLKVLATYYTNIGPLLRDGHEVEAKQLAAEIAKASPHRFI